MPARGGKEGNVLNYHLLVVRIDAEGRLRNSKPCAECIGFMRRFGGIKNVYYSNDQGELVCEPLATISSTHSTNGTRALRREKIIKTEAI